MNPTALYTADRAVKIKRFTFVSMQTYFDTRKPFNEDSLIMKYFNSRYSVALSFRIFYRGLNH